MNKMFKKFMAVTATAAIAASMSIPAFAAGEIATHTDGSVSVTGYAAVEGAKQYTVMVFSCAKGADITKVVPASDAAIYYINQGTNPSTLLTGMLVKATDKVNALPDGDYVVRIGNDAKTTTVTNIALNVTTTQQEDPKDYITATEAGKATVNTLAATASDWIFDGMACRVTIALDAEAYPNGTYNEDTKLYTKNYTLTPVDANGVAIEGAEIYFAQQTGKYVALIPTTAEAGYKFEVTEGTSTNTSFLYGDMNADGSLKPADKTIAARVITQKLTDAKYKTNLQNIRLDANGDGKIKAADKTIIARYITKKITELPVFSK